MPLFRSTEGISAETFLQRLEALFRKRNSQDFLFDEGD